MTIMAGMLTPREQSQIMLTERSEAASVNLETVSTPTTLSV